MEPLCIMDTLGQIVSVLIFQVSLYDKAAPFGTITKCVDYIGVLISSVRFHCIWFSKPFVHALGKIIM